MSVLILHRNPLEPFPYDRWLADYPGDLVMLADRKKIELFAELVPEGDLGYAHLEVLDDFDDDRYVLDRSLELAAKYGVRYVVAHHEADVDRAAVLRERLGLPGPLPADVLPFRDKALMKRLVAEHGVEVAAHRVPRTAGEARSFAAEHGYPVVVKDRAGMNSVGLRILRDDAELDEHLGQAFPGGSATRDDLLIEKFVPGRMCHVDGLVAGGRTVLSWPSQYQYDLASYGTDPGARIDLTLDPSDPLTGRLLALTETIRSALQRDRLRDYAFHAEIFHTPDDRLVLCEIASRPGGAKIREVQAALFGINLGEYATRVQVGLPLPALTPGAPPPGPARMAGQVLMMKRPGRVRSVPARPAEPWVEHFWLYAEPGQVLQPATGSSDFLVAAIATGPDRVECERRLRALGTRWAAETSIVAPA
jgi:hypothetical protein